MQTMLQDLRYALRNLLKAKSFTAIAAATLAIGVGANTAIFSIIDTILLRPLPYRDPDRLVRLWETEAAPGKYPFAGPDFIDWKTSNRSFEDMTLYGWMHDMNIADSGQVGHVRAIPTEANFFSLLGVRPIMGRTWVAGEDMPGKDRVAVLSYALWRSQFAGDPRVVGRTVLLDSERYTIVGVMPAAFRFPWSTVQLWVPMEMDSKGLGQRGSHWAQAIGRLKPGISIKAAQAELKAIAAQLEKEYPDSNDKVGGGAGSLKEALVGDSRDTLFTLLAAVGVVLLIACANVANLLLSRAMARHREMAVRTALGAGRWRLVRQLLTETSVLFIVGGAAGIVLAWGLVRLFTQAKSFTLPQFNVIQINAEVLAFGFAIALVTGLLFGLVPALQTSRPDLGDELKGGAGASISPHRGRRLASDILVVAEIGLSLVLLVSAALLLQDFVRLRNKDIGVQPEGVWTAAVWLPESAYKENAQQNAFVDRLLEAARRLPGVESAALSNRLPLEGGSNGYVRLREQGSAPMSPQLVETHDVSADYFRAMGIRVRRGRVFNGADVQQERTVSERIGHLTRDGGRLTPEQSNGIVRAAVINEAMARHFWPNQDPVGRMFAWGSSTGPWRQVVGVVEDVREWGLTEKAVPEAYTPFDANSRLFLVLRGVNGNTEGVTAGVRRELARIDGNLPLFSVRTMNQVIGDHAQGQQFLSLLVGSFAVFAALLAAIGIYGVLSYLVTQRTREIGIRLSLGATRGRVLGHVLRDGMVLAAAGVLCGFAGALAAGRILAGMLHEVRPFEPTLFAATALLLAAIALAACYVPARRAARLDPMTALRYE
jgi:predicted permease